MSLAGRSVFVTGGLGYIASHTVLVLLEHGARVTMIDNMSNSFLQVFDHMKELAGDKADQMTFIKADITDRESLRPIFEKEKFDAVIHFAGYKAVGESVAKPLMYYHNNFVGTVILLEVLKEYGCTNIVFSSSCTVYGMVETVPITEDTPLAAISPYGRTKLFQEEMFRDLAASDDKWNVLLLRYFNPIGAHPSGHIGEHPVGIPNNLLPYIQQVALGQREYLRVFGGDYPTPDGSAVRDYIHVMDLAEGHAAAVRKLLGERLRCKAINLGTGRGTSVLEMIRAFEAASSVQVPFKVVARRPGDTVEVWAGTKLAEEELGWKAKFDIDDMCRDQWRWASRHPRGYTGEQADSDMCPDPSCGDGERASLKGYTSAATGEYRDMVNTPKAGAVNAAFGNATTAAAPEVVVAQQ